MNKPKATKGLIPIRDYAKSRLSRRGFPVSVQYIYKLIALHKKTGKELDFEFKEVGKEIWIKKP